MYNFSSHTASLKDVLGYTLPTLHTGNTWYIDFMCFDSTTQKMRRKKYMLNRYKKPSVRRAVATELIASLTVKLRSGWSPWAFSPCGRQYTKITAVIEIYVSHLEKLLETAAIKQNTYLDYTKRLRVLKKFMNDHHEPITYIYELTETYVSDFLDYLLLDRKTSSRTRNNYKLWLSSFCNWCIEKQYLDHNPTERIKSLKEDKKRRAAISNQHLRKLQEYLLKEDQYFLLCCRMEYYTFIRPEELTNIRLKDIHLHEQKVFVSSCISKNRADGAVGLCDEVIKQMIDLKIFTQYDDGCYLFSDGFRPGRKKLSAQTLRRHFYKVRAALHLPDTYQFYSLKDSGIRDLANAAGIVVARDQARHSDVTTTNKYLSGSTIPVHEETKHFVGDL